MKTVNYYSKGTTVYFFTGHNFKLVETVVEDVLIRVPDIGEPVITYTVEDNLRNTLKLDSAQVFEDRETLKARVLENFKPAVETDV